MRENPIQPGDLTALWQSQPQETQPVLPPSFIHLRVRQLSSSNRAEVYASLAAAVLFAAVLLARFPLSEPLIAVSLSFTAVWITATVIAFRSLLRLPDVAAPGIDFYRAEIQRRRSHLRRIWVWHGPSLLAGGFLIWFVLRGAPISPDRLLRLGPFLLLLISWVAFGVRRRWQESAALQWELDELARLEQNRP